MEQEHRRRRAREMGVLGVITSACLIGASTGIRATTSMGTPIHLNSLTMESTTAGWGIDRHLGGQLVHTVNGGRTWINVTPADVTFDEPTDHTSYSPPLPPHNTVTWYGSSLVAKTVTQLARSPQGAVLLVSTTTNGGRTWRQWKVRLPDLVDRSLNDPILHQVDFNGNDGWLVFGPAYPSAAGMNYTGMELWHTSNGGHTWTRMNQSAEIIAGPVAFANATMGWTTRRVGMNPQVLLHTMNAGRTWTPVSLAAGAPTGVPIFHGASGVVFVARQNLAPRGFSETYHVIASMDAGQHWEPARRIPEPTSVLDVSFFTVPVDHPQVIWDLSGHTLWRSINSGRAWTVQSRAKALIHNPFLDAVSRRAVWAWNATVGTSPTMARTTDGGRTWTSWTPMLMREWPTFAPQRY